MRRGLFLLLLGVALLPATVFLLPDGYFASSDGMIHLYRLFELDRSLHAGVLFPRWFPLSGYGYGLPVLNYYPPLTYYLGELFHLAGAGYVAAIKLTIATGFVLAALAMFFFTRDLLGDGAAFVAAIAYASSPYLLSDAYVRGNFPEMLTMALLPFALWAFTRIKAEGRGMKDEDSFISHLSSLPFLFAALTFAAIILTHHLTAMQFAPLLLAYLVFLFLLRRDVKHLLACGIALVLALMLSAFYWLPALTELDLVYVGPAAVARFLVNRLIAPADFFTPSLAYTYLPQSDALKHAFGFPQTLVALLAGVIALVHVLHLTFWNIAVNVKNGNRNVNTKVTVNGPSVSRFRLDLSERWGERSLRFSFYVLFFCLLVAFSIFMTLTPSAPLWYAIPILRFMQFPWRFQILAAIGIAFLLGVWAKWIANALARFKANWVAYPAFTIALIALGIANLPVRPFALSDAEVDLTRASDSAYVVAQMGWGWTREFIPATVQEFEGIYAPVAKSQVPPPDPARPSPSIQIQNDGLYSRALRVSTAQPFELSLKTFFFPGWQAYIDDEPVRTYPRGSLGLVSVAVPAGDHAILFRFEDTPFRAAVNAVSLVTLVGVLVGLFIARRRAFVALIGAAILISALGMWHTREANAQSPIAVAANLDQRVELIGYTTERAGETLNVTLYWLALNEMDRDYNSYAHLIDAAGNVVAQHDGPTAQGLTPTTRWLPGEIVADRHALALRDVPPGEYRLAAGMYLPLENGFQSLGDRVDLGRVRVVK